MRAVLLILCSGLLCGAALAADPPASPAPPSAAPPLTPKAPPPLDEATGANLATLFTEFCVKAFPDGAALEARMRDRGAIAMTPEQVKGILHDDPGRGWIVRLEGHGFLVTEEAPPFHACSVRVNTPAGVPNGPLSRIVGDLAGESGRRVSSPQVLNRNDNPLMQISAALVTLSPPPAGADAETFMAFVTTYRDKTSNAVVTVENRFVRQIHAAPQR